MEGRARQLMKQKRKELGWTQEEVGSWINMDQSLYSKKERGVTELFADEWLEIMTQLEIHGRKPKPVKLPFKLELVS